MIFHSHRHGVSPLIASVLLVVFTISIAGILVTWLNNYAASTTEEAEVTNQNLLDCSKQRPIIDTVFANSSNSSKPIVRVAVRNGGSEQLTLKSLQVFSSEGTSCNGYGIDGTVLQVGNSTVFNFTSVCSITCSTFELARVTTTCGSSSGEFSAKSLIVGC